MFCLIPSIWRAVCSFLSLVVVLSVPVEKKISLSVFQIRENGAILHWEGSDFSHSCVVSYMINGSQEIPMSNIYSDNKTLELTDLAPLTFYSVYLLCQSGELKERSQLNFTTAPAGKVYDFTPEITPSSPIKPSSTENPSSVDNPSIIKKRIQTDSDPVDVALGVIFGIIALGVVCTIGYYFFRKFRRQQRIRRFLQYRQQENDPFPDIDAEIEEDDSTPH